MTPLWLRLSQGLASQGLDLATILSRCNFPSATSQGTEFGRSYECAVSGGQDSLCLVVLAKLVGLEPTAHHVDHGLRNGSDLEAERLRSMLFDLEIPVVSHTIEIHGRSNLEERARELRYASLPVDVATGHTLDDQAETMMINLLRGAGLKGMSGMEPSTSKPLLAVRRYETAAVCESVGLDPIIDESNFDSSFLRNRVRHELLPLMSQISGRDVSALLARQASMLLSEDEYLDMESELIGRLEPKLWSSQSRVLLRRYLRRQVGLACGVRIDQATTLRLEDVVRGEVRACNVEGGFIFRKSKGRFEIWRHHGGRVAILGAPDEFSSPT